MAETVRFNKHSSSKIVPKFPLLQVYFGPEQEKHFGWILFQAKDVKLLTIQPNKLVSKRPVIFMAHLSPTALTPAFAVFLLTSLRNVPTNWTLRRQAIIGKGAWMRNECVPQVFTISFKMSGSALSTWVNFIKHKKMIPFHKLGVFTKKPVRTMCAEIISPQL